MVFSEKINNFQEKVFDFVVIIIYILIVVSFLGFSEKAPTFLNNLDYYFRVYICLFLIWRFNSFRSVDKFTSLDRKIACNSGIIILTTTILNTYINNIKNSAYVNNVKTHIQTIVDPIVDPNSQ